VSSTALVDPPPEATRVAGRYRRTERLVGAGVAVLVGGVAVAALLVLPFAFALAVFAGLLLTLRLPVFRTEGRTVLRTDADPDAVRRALAGPTPPVLALQWGIADAVEQPATAPGTGCRTCSVSGRRRWSPRRARTATW
jgi:hypothetical protein